MTSQRRVPRITRRSSLASSGQVRPARRARALADHHHRCRRGMIAAPLLLALATCSCDMIRLPRSSFAPDDGRPRVLYVGDSITTGIEHLIPSMPNGARWWAHVDDALGVRGTVYARAGWRTEDALGAPAGADLVIVALGANDEGTGVDPFAYRLRLVALASRHRTCLIVSPWAATGWQLAVQASRTHPHEQYELNALAAARAAGCGFVDWGNVDSAAPHMSYDGLHPTPDGSTVLGRAVTSALVG